MGNNEATGYAYFLMNPQDNTKKIKKSFCHCRYNKIQYICIKYPKQLLSNHSMRNVQGISDFAAIAKISSPYLDMSDFLHTPRLTCRLKEYVCARDIKEFPKKIIPPLVLGMSGFWASSRSGKVFPLVIAGNKAIRMPRRFHLSPVPHRGKPSTEVGWNFCTTYETLNRGRLALLYDIQGNYELRIKN
jgi:hypothetical protein